MVTTLLVTHHKTPMEPAAKTKQLLPPRGRPSMGHMVIPYVQGLGESIKYTCRKYGIQTHFKGNRTHTQMLVKPKDKDHKEKTSGVIYCYQCAAIDSGEEYIGETSRTLG